ncbi:hypothetical protein PVAND_000166 [Polypedilum vanderplanki]|uniref:Adenosine deaminase n=1 Tax=Polypedilum vanderplanki TaxID=319348 RepID=A0A9J6BK19_POLVA|nr:hypothetical protein PVAND_000166 [Polypedilum vanderplanki]
MRTISTIFIAISFFHYSRSATIFNNQLNYKDVRNNIIAAEESIRTGGNIYLSPKEHEADKILLTMKEKSINRGIIDPSSYAPSLHFFHAKPLIEKDPIFDIIKRLPKGGVLHLHNSAGVSSEWVIKNLTYRNDVKLCNSTDGEKIFTTVPTKACQSEPIPIPKLRAQAQDVKEFDKSLELMINLYTKYPELDYPDVNTVWKKFQNIFSIIGGIFDYLPTYKAFHRRLLEELYEDNVMYLEMRTGMGGLIDENGNKLNSDDVALVLLNLVDEFKKDHPLFLGLKVILAIPRNSDTQSLELKMQRFVELRKKYPNFVIGFDLVGQEDIGRPLSQYVEKLKEISQNGRFFFHAGETNWFNTDADHNLIDAILMNTKRIGHGYSLYKHPVLWEAFKEKDIALEISPISNQVLHLVQDLRNHPASFYISENIPIVIANDDPGFWNAKGLSYDFYYAFMAFAPSDTGLQILKQLAWNSLKYSAMSQKERSDAAVVFKASWDKFIDSILLMENKNTST